MKTIVHTLIALLVLFMNTESYAYSGKPNDYRNNFIGSLVPLSPRNWELNDIEVPENLKFIKAKTALVPVAEFVLGNPDEAAPIELLMSTVPVPAKVWEEETTEVPEGLENINAKYALVPVPARHYVQDDSIPVVQDDKAPFNQHALVQNFVK
ncbi:hypothetical protein SAMN05421813_10811 [Daejeonella rubra]|uniref:Uncharacterized protein n=1 Tax=Daejeonella rubra TaxID=990371 RepID=A0A1G9RHK6_9SPHI|nr:hypothetical protein [Daejeonella rubra]SDM22347.1 hypothetical protein SAMN05421813_10811 [Daejeonella rubra]